MKRVSLEAAWAGEADCRNCALRASVLFSGLDAADFELIHQPIDQFDLAPGARLYRAGDPGESVFTVRKGTLKLVQYVPDGSQRIVRLVHQTDTLGLEAILDEAYQHEAVVLHDAEICRIPTSVVRSLADKSPGLHQELLRRWQRALAEADAWLTELSTGSAKQRVARLLLRLASRAEDGRCALFGREDMGAILGITTETASRIIAQFRRQRILTAEGTGRFACDLQQLRRIADE